MFPQPDKHEAAGARSAAVLLPGGAEGKLQGMQSKWLLQVRYTFENCLELLCYDLLLFSICK